MITNKYWNIEKTWNYWLDLQRRSGIVPRDESFKASSAFDVKKVDTKNPKQVGAYLTKYVTKNKAELNAKYGIAQNLSQHSIQTSILITAF